MYVMCIFCLQFSSDFGTKCRLKFLYQLAFQLSEQILFFLCKTNLLNLISIDFYLIFLSDKLHRIISCDKSTSYVTDIKYICIDYNELASPSPPNAAVL